MTAAQFAEVARAVPYVRKGMFYSEVFLFLQHCAQARVDCVIESGVRDGISTRLLHGAFRGEICSIERRREVAAPVAGAMVYGDACTVLPALLAGPYLHRRVGILIDGPKDGVALALKDTCLAYPATQVVGIHDLPPGGGETAHSFDEAFRATAGDPLDALIVDPYREKYPRGPGLAIWRATCAN
jgi:hypothetical protein